MTDVNALVHSSVLIFDQVKDTHIHTSEHVLDSTDGSSLLHYSKNKHSFLPKLKSDLKNRNLRRIAVDKNGKREEDEPPPTSSSQRTSPVRPFAPSSS